MSKIDELRREYDRLAQLIGYPGAPETVISSARGSTSHAPPQKRGAIAPSGTLRAELEDVRGKLARVSVDTSHEEIQNLLELEATLALRLERGEAELARRGREIGYAEQIAQGEATRIEHERREWQKRREIVLAQIADIDDHLAGRKLIKVAPGPRGDDFADNMARARQNLKQLRARVMQENALSEADISV